MRHINQNWVLIKIVFKENGESPIYKLFCSIWKHHVFVVWTAIASTRPSNISCSADE